MDAREEMKRWITAVIQNAPNETSKLVKDDIDLVLGAAGQLAGILTARYEALAKKSRPSRPKPPKLAPAKPLQQDSSHKSSTDAPKTKVDAQDAQNQPDRTSRIQQGIRKAARTPKSQQQALLRQIYGPHNKDVAFQKAAKILAS